MRSIIVLAIVSIVAYYLYNSINIPSNSVSLRNVDSKVARDLRNP
jgi:hypothetical protein